MSVCPKFKGMCVDEAGMRFVDCGGDCARCAANGGLSITIAELEDLYRAYQAERKVCRPVTINGNINALHAFTRTMKLSGDAKVSAITKEMLREFYDVYPASEVTRKGIVDALRKMNGECFREWVKAHGKTLDALPSVSGLKASVERYKPISAKSRTALGDLRFTYRNLDDPRKWMALTLGLKQGWAKSDVLRAVWSDFREEDGVLVTDKRRNKTGKQMLWIVDEDDRREWKRVEDIMRHTTKFCARFNIKGTEESLFRIPIAPRDRVVVSEVINEINKDLRKTIPEWEKDDKAFHNLRKEFSSFVCHTYGWDVAESATGDTTPVLRKYYVGKKELDFNQLKGLKI